MTNPYRVYDSLAKRDDKHLAITSENEAALSKMIGHKQMLMGGPKSVVAMALLTLTV